MRPKSSGLDNKGNLYVDCAECQRGGNGDKSCSVGAKHKEIYKGMCFSGQLLEKYSLKN